MDTFTWDGRETFLQDPTFANKNILNELRRDYEEFVYECVTSKDWAV